MARLITGVDPSLISSRNCSRITISRLIAAPQVVSPGGDNIQNIIPPLCRRVFRRAGHCRAAPQVSAPEDTLL